MKYFDIKLKTDFTRYTFKLLLKNIERPRNKINIRKKKGGEPFPLTPLERYKKVYFDPLNFIFCIFNPYSF